MTESEHTKLLSQCKAVGCSNLSDFVRGRLTGDRVRVERVKKVDPDLLYQLNKIGNLINQIARHANTQKSLDIECLSALQACQKELERLC